MHRPLQQRGFSLIEVLVAMVLSIVLAVAAFTVFYNSQRATRSVTSVIENRQNSRTAVQLLERDLRMAGSGWGQMNVTAVYNGTDLSIPPVTPFYGGSDAANDTLGIIGAWDAATSLKAGMPNVTSNLQVNDLTGFQSNDFCVVTNSQTAHLFQVTGVNVGGLLLLHATSSKYNVYDVTGTFPDWPQGGYKTGAKVYRVSFASYQLDTLSNPRDQLVRWTQNSTRQVVAYNVQQFKVGYLMSSDTLTRNPDDLSEIVEVRPVLCMKTKSTTTTKALSDSSTAIVKPRSF